MNKHFVFLLGYILTCTFNASSQSLKVTDVDKRLTPSTTTASLSQFGGMDVNKSTGRIGKMIKLFETKQGRLVYAPVIQYSSAGVHMNEWGGRLGMTWNDNFTATIQRTVRSLPDDEAANSRRIPKESIAGQDLNALYLYDTAVSNFLSQTGKGQRDCEYDIFSYNIFGASGTFLIDGGQAKLLDHSDTVFISVLSTSPYTFKVTNTAGIKYYFGLDGAIEHSSNYNENMCDEPANPILNRQTAWFLNKMVSPEKDSIMFTYGSLNYDYLYDFAESATASISHDPNGTGVDYSHQYCGREKNAATKYLTQVSGKNFTVEFLYKLGPRNDLYNEKLYDKLVLKDKNGSIISRHEFTYDEVVSQSSVENTLQSSINNVNWLALIKSRYFLNAYKSKGIHDTGYLEHKFHYLSPNELPHRFSFAQDVAGYYNAQAYNTGFIPRDRAFAFLPSSYSQHFESLGYLGDRNPAWDASAYGLLNRIEYPTGGSDTIIYEANSYTIDETILTTGSTNGSFTCTSNSWQSQHQSSTFTVPFLQKVKLDVSTGYSNGSLPYDNDGSIYWVEFQLWNVTTNSAVSIPHPTVIYNSVTNEATMKIYEYYGDSVQLEPGYEYQFRCNLYGLYTKVDFNIGFYDGSYVVETEKPYYGQRVKKIVTRSNTNSNRTTLYRYKLFTQNDDLLTYSTRTSANISEELYPSFGNHVTVPVVCPSCTSGPLGSPVNISVENYRMGSSYPHDLNRFSGNNISYSHITQFLDEDETSFVASEFLIDPDLPATRIGGDLLPSVPISNYGWRNGLEFQKFSGTKEAPSSYRVFKKELTGYEFISIALQYSNFIVQETYDPILLNNINISAVTESPAYSVAWYPLFNLCHKMTYAESTEYFRSGPSLNTMTSTIQYEYGNESKLLSSQSSTDSKGLSTQTTIRGPKEMVDNSLDPTGIYQQMVNDHVLAEQVEVRSYRNAQLLSTERTKFHSPNTGMYLPQYTTSQKAGMAEYTQLRYHNYDNNGNPGCISMDKDVKTCYLWGYGKKLLIAKVVNMDYAALVTVLGGQTVVDAFLDQTNPSDVNVNTFLQPLRNGTIPAAAHVFTFLHKPLIGMTAATDQNGNTTHYEFDTLNRLRLIRDKDNKVIKVFDYKYQTSTNQ